MRHTPRRVRAEEDDPAGFFLGFGAVTSLSGPNEAPEKKIARPIGFGRP